MQRCERRVSLSEGHNDAMWNGVDEYFFAHSAFKEKIEMKEKKL